MWITNIEDSDQKQESPSTYINVFSHTLTTCYNSFEYQIFYDIITQCVQYHMFIAPISQYLKHLSVYQYTVIPCNSYLSVIICVFV